MRPAIVLLMAALMFPAACARLPASADETPATAPQSAPAGEIRLEKLWTATGFSAPEGVAVAPDGSCFISNVAGEPGAKDGNGFISHLAANGMVTEKIWADGLDAPKGMTIAGNQLYVADLTRIVRFDIASGERLGEITVPGAKSLNDMTLWQGEVIVSDSGTGSVWRVSPAGASLIISGKDFAGANGVLGDGDSLLIATMDAGNLIRFSDIDDSFAIIATGMKNADGIGLVPGGGWLVSGWPGQIHHVTESGAVRTLMDTEADGTLQNDLTVTGDTVIVPNWLPGTVTAWRITRGAPQ